jgi:7-carboxy-7-deazaguanine synthase
VPKLAATALGRAPHPAPLAFPTTGPGRLRLSEHYLCSEGEGSTLGALTYLVRLSGCDLRCSWCDTKFSSFYDDDERSIDVKTVEAAALKSGAAWVSFTGGEPTYRSEAELKTLAGLAGRLRRRGLKVKVESNGRRLPQALEDCVDLWSLAPKWDGRKPSAKARTAAMDYDEASLALFARRYGDGRLQLKFVIGADGGEPRPADLARARAILKSLPPLPVFFIPEAYAAGDYLARVKALEKAVAGLARGPLKGWDLRVQPQMHRILYGDQRGR